MNFTTPVTKKHFTRFALLFTAGALALTTFTGCAQNTASQTTPTVSEKSAHKHESKDAVHVHEMWAKAAESGGMTAVFGNIHSNLADEEITVVSATSPAAAKVELHEVVAGKMQPLGSGIKLAADAEVDLEPGGIHIMLLGLKHDLLAGDTVEVTLQLSNKTEFTFKAQIRDYNGAREDYDHDTHDDHGEHDEHEDHNDH